MSYKTKRGKLVRTAGKVSLDQVDSMCDIQVEAKVERVVMIYANDRGRRAVEDLWPDVEWSTDDVFSSGHSPDWLFTHIRVTRLPPHLEKTIPLAFASPDALGFAVASSIQRNYDPERVIYYSGQGRDIHVNIFDVFRIEPGADFALFADYVPAGIELALSEVAS